jgi:hypothetical protein
MAVIVSGLEIKGRMSGIGNYKCRRQKLVIDAGQQEKNVAIFNTGHKPEGKMMRAITCSH